MKKYPSQGRLRELFDYHHDGYLVWRYRADQRNCVNARFEGKRAGAFGVKSNLKKFNEIRIGKYLYKTSELIYIFHYGEIPSGKSVISDNSDFIKISDIRLLESNDRTGVQHANRLANGFVGVSRKGNGFAAVFCGAHLGTFLTQEAAAACVDYEIRKKHGKSAAKNIDQLIDYEKCRIKPRTIQKKKKENGRMQGCYFDKRKKSKPWYSKLGNKGLGYFSSETEAARAYNIAAYQHYGENAVLNDIPDPLGEGDLF